MLAREGERLLALLRRQAAPDVVDRQSETDSTGAEACHARILVAIVVTSSARVVTVVVPVPAIVVTTPIVATLIVVTVAIVGRRGRVA